MCHPSTRRSEETAEGKESIVTPQEVRVGMRVRVAEHYRIAERRGMAGRVVGSYGGEYVVVDVSCPDGKCRLFWPGNLEEVPSAPPSWWRSLIGRGSAQ